MNARTRSGWDARSGRCGSDPDPRRSAFTLVELLVAVTSAHRGEAFDACEFIIDYLKTQAPFWKKEQTPSGARWVDARVSDDEAMAKWDRSH